MKRTINPANVRKPFGQYNHGLAMPVQGTLLVTSGQLGISPDETIPESVEDQAEICFQAIAAILEEAGMSFSDVVRIGGFVTRREDFAPYMAVRDRYTLEPRPVSTLLIVTGFTRPEFKVEVEITAVKSAL